MLGSSKTEREYNQEQILLNSVSSIGIPLSLATSTSTSTSNLLYTTTSLSSLNRSNVLLATSTPTIPATPATGNNLTQSTVSLNQSQTQSSNNTVSNTNKNDNKKDKNNEKESKKNDTELVSDITLKNISKTENEDLSFKFQDNSNDMSTETTVTTNNINQNEEDNKNKLENISTSLFLPSSLPLNLDDTNDFLNMDIDLLNSSLTSGLEDINSLTLDINSTAVTSVDTSASVSAVDITSINSGTTDTTSATITTASSTETSHATLISSSPSEDTTTTTTSALISSSSSSSFSSSSLKNSPSSSIAVTTKKEIKSEENDSKSDTATTTTSEIVTDNNPLDPIITDTTDKKDILEFFNAEDFENNLKLFPFPNQSLLLPPQKNLEDNGSLLTDPSLTGPAPLSVLPNSNDSTNANSAVNSTTNPNTSTTTSTIKATTVPTMVQPTDQAMALNSSLNINSPPVVTADVNAKPMAGIPQNSIMGLPSMMNNATFFNLNADPNVPNALPNNISGGSGQKMNYYHQPNLIVKAPPPSHNEVIMKKVYNGIVKQENINDMQKKAQGRDVLKTQLSTELNEANPNVKINMKSVKSGAPKGRRVQSRNASLRPTLSYVELITEAICDSEDGLLSLQEIYDAIKRKYVYFRTADPAWQNSIRHNLSVHQSFSKITRPPNRPGKGFLWTSSKIDYQNLSSESRKRRKREHNEKSQIMGPNPSNNKNQPYHNNFPATTNVQMATTNIPQQNIPNNMNDINYLLNQQHPRISQKVMKILTDSSINTPSLKQLLFTGFKQMSNEPYHGHNGMNYSMNSFDGYHRQSHSSSMYGGSQFLVNSSAYSAAQMTNTSMPLSLNSLIMQTSNASSSLPGSNPPFACKGSNASFQNTFTNTTSNLPLSNIEGIGHQKYISGSSLYPSLLDPEYSYRYPSHSMFRSGYYYSTPNKNDLMMHNTTRRYSFDSAMTSSAAFAAAARNNASNPNNPTPPFFSLAKSQNAKNVPTGPNYIKKDRDKKIMHEKMHLTPNDYSNIVNQHSAPYPGNSSNYIPAATTASTATGAPPLNYSHKHLSTNYNNNLPVLPSSYNSTDPVPNIPSTKPLTTPMINDTKSEHNALDVSALSTVAPTVIENDTPMIVTNKEQA
ncbi:hypothetical protein H8356DRAFT_948222 [Neocallimastix lanati (nom. inval.)]|nr:hypothetical protein H8356DRAFT_948222 [Neocallimastix sp. JGI-2020a]